MAGNGTEARRARILARLTPEQQLEVMTGRPTHATYAVIKDTARDEMTRRPVPNRAERRKAARHGKA